MLADGNCLYRCFSRILFGHDNFHRKIRLSLLNHVILHWTRFGTLLTEDTIYTIHDNKEWVVTSPDDYRDIMSKDGSFGGEIEILSSKQYQRKYTDIR